MVHSGAFYIHLLISTVIVLINATGEWWNATGEWWKMTRTFVHAIVSWKHWGATSAFLLFTVMCVDLHVPNISLDQLTCSLKHSHGMSFF